MIIFFEKKTGKAIGTIEGRVHPKEHLVGYNGEEVTIIPHGLTKDDVDKVIVGWTEDDNVRTPHNIHLLDLLKEFENPHNPKNPLTHKVTFQSKQVL